MPVVLAAPVSTLAAAPNPVVGAVRRAAASLVVRAVRKAAASLAVRAVRRFVVPSRVQVGYPVVSPTLHFAQYLRPAACHSWGKTWWAG